LLLFTRFISHRDAKKTKVTVAHPIPPNSLAVGNPVVVKKSWTSKLIFFWDWFENRINLVYNALKKLRLAWLQQNRPDGVASSSSPIEKHHPPKRTLP
jgi:hypothetical protein